MSGFPEETLDIVWQKGCKVEGLDLSVYRTDAANALMKRSLYGQEGNLGWEVDHIFPKEKLKDKDVPDNRWDDIVNLRPMNAKNNVAKGEEYPEYNVAVQMDGNALRNKEVENKRMVVNKDVRHRIRENYKKWL